MGGDLKERGGKTQAAMRFVLAAIWFFVADVGAHLLSIHVGAGAAVIVYRLSFVVLLLIGFCALGFGLDGQRHPLRAMGFVRRGETGQEIGMGLALGWGMVATIVLVMALARSLHVETWWELRAWDLLVRSVVLLAIGAVLEEVAFRGYAFQRLIDAVGPAWATVLMAVLLGARQTWAGATGAGVLVAVVMTVLFSVAYLRTRSLWLPIALRFGWNASLGLLFGLPVGGALLGSVVQTRAVGAQWLTGGEYGPEGSVVAMIVLLGGMVVLVKMTSDLAYKYSHPEIVAAGYEVGVAPPAAHVAMEAAATAKGPALVQILPETPRGQSIPPRVPPGN